MQSSKTAKEIIILLGISVVAAFTVNFFSPSGIAPVGQWDDSKGVITAKAKNDVFVDEFEIDDVKIAKQFYDSGKPVEAVKSSKSYHYHCQMVDPVVASRSVSAQALVTLGKRKSCRQ